MWWVFVVVGTVIFIVAYLTAYTAVVCGRCILALFLGRRRLRTGPPVERRNVADGIDAMRDRR